jgi:hypothetical protein
MTAKGQLVSRPRFESSTFRIHAQSVPTNLACSAGCLLLYKRRSNWGSICLAVPVTSLSAYSNNISFVRSANVMMQNKGLQLKIFLVLN